MRDTIINVPAVGNNSPTTPVESLGKVVAVTNAGITPKNLFRA